DLASGPPVAGVPGTCLWLLKDGMLLHLGESIVVVIDEGLGLSRGEEGREGVVPTATVKVARKELHLMPMPLLKLKAVAFSEKKCCTFMVVGEAVKMRIQQKAGTLGGRRSRMGDSWVLLEAAGDGSREEKGVGDRKHS
ncbi:hypothetical protein GW17_00053791, partial [Ensete ventricosum]